MLGLSIHVLSIFPCLLYSCDRSANITQMIDPLFRPRSPGPAIVQNLKYWHVQLEALWLVPRLLVLSAKISTFSVLDLCNIKIAWVSISAWLYCYLLKHPCYSCKWITVTFSHVFVVVFPFSVKHSMSYLLDLIHIPLKIC